MANLFIGFPVPRAKIADMITGAAPPLKHIENHRPPGSDPLVLPGDISSGQIVKWDGSKFVGIAEPSGGIASRYADNDIFLCTNFESLDGFTTSIQNSGEVNLEYRYLDIYTNTTVASWAYIAKQHAIQFPVTTWNKVHKFKAMVYFWSNPDNTGLIYIGMGRAHDGRHIGFLIEDGLFQGSVHNGTNQSKVTLEDWGSGSYAKTKNLEAIFTPGSKAEFYISGVKEGEITTNLPSGSTDSDFWFFYYTANSAEGKRNRSRISQFQFTQAE
ncbi:hypothetical protein ES702_06258 [subsurface metagenome]